jgi:hypothetical protein
MLAVGIWGAPMGGRSVWTLPVTSGLQLTPRTLSFLSLLRALQNQSPENIGLHCGRLAS